MKRSREEEQELTALIKKYDKYIRWKASIFTSRLRGAPGNCRDDLFQAGVCGLIQARDSFDQSFDVPFQAHIFMTIENAIRDEYLKCQGLTNKNRGRFNKLKRFDEDARVLERIYCRNVSHAEVADFCAVAEDDLLGGLYTPVDEGDVPVFVEQGVDRQADVDTEHEAHVSEVREAVQSALAGLPERDAQLFKRIFFDDATLTEIGRELGVTKQMVWKLKQQLMSKVKDRVAGKVTAQDI